MVVKNANIHNIMGGMESTGGVRLHNHRRKLKQRFDIIRKLGQGTYGKVQLGINKETGQEVAIKTIKKAKIETEADLIRIRREIQIMSSVQHPNIIHIYEVFENREKMVLVMEYAAGGELYDYLSERKVLSQDEARRIFRQIATAVFYCHKHKICHRDLKLENILLDEHGNAKIADFGLSNVFDEQRLLNTFCGSPLYASPEIVKGTPYHGPEVDCWSLGVLLYTLVYGAMPFDGSNFKRLVKQISQGDYFEPKKPSPASSLIREMLTVSPARRADIEKVCSHWWVNEGYSDSCLQIAEELADQTPVRLDLLLSLAPSPSGVSTENIIQQGMSNSPSAPHSMVPTRCHSVGSLMELDHTATEQQQQQPRAFGATGKQPIHGDSRSNSTQSMSCATPGHWDSAKRKLEEGASSSEVNLRGAVKRDRGKRKSCEEHADAQSAGKAKTEAEEKVGTKLDQEEEKMDVEETSDSTFSGTTNLPESMESFGVSKDSGVETQDDCFNTSNEMESTCKSSTVSSTATIVPAEDSSSVVLSSPDEHVPIESPLLDVNCSKNKKTMKKKHDSGSELKNGNDVHKDLEKSLSGVSCEKKDSTVSKETRKSSDSPKEKHKKATEINEVGKTSKTISTKNSESGNISNKISKAIVTAANSTKNVTALPAVKDEKEKDLPKTNAKVSKSKGDLVLDNLTSDASSINNSSEPSTPPPTTVERRRSKIFETADKFNSLAVAPEAKGMTREKPKKLFIPGVKVSDFKKAFERKLSSPEISVSAFSKKYPLKSDEAPSEKLDKTPNNELNDNSNNTKIDNQVDERVDNNTKIKTQEDDQTQEDVKEKKSKSPGKSSIQNDVKKESTLDSNKTKSIKTPTETNKNSKSVINSKSVDSSLEGNIIDNAQPISRVDEMSATTDMKSRTDLSDSHEKAGPQVETATTIQDGENDITLKTLKPIDATGKKKSSKVEITLKSATLPRRKTSKAEIKLDPAIPPIEFKTEIAHMVNAPTTDPSPVRLLENESTSSNTAPPFRSWSLEPDSSHLSKMASRECIIPIQIERESKENLTSPPVGRPPAYPFQQRSMSQTPRSNTLSRQSTQESDSEVMEPIRKSPREYIIPIAVEGGGYVTPRAGSLEPSTSDDGKSKSRSMSSTRSNHYRRMSSLLSDTSEDEGFNMSPVGVQRHGSLGRGRDDGRTFHFHRLRSSRPMRHSLERNDSLSSAEEDDDDDDDEGFEILTAESLFSTLLSRVRSLTQRLTVEDGKRPGFPSNHFVNQLTNINHPTTSFKNFYSQHREPLSRRLSETSSFPRLRGDLGSMHQRSLSRDSSNCDSANSDASCSIGTFPRGSAHQKHNPCDNAWRGTRNSPTSYQYGSGVPRGGGWQNKYSDGNLYPFQESSIRKSLSSGKSVCKSPSHCVQSYMCPRKLSRTLSLRSATEDKILCNSPLVENALSKYSGGLVNERQNHNVDSQLAKDTISLLPFPHNSEKVKSSAYQNITSIPPESKSQDLVSGILPPLPQSSLSENKCNSIPRPIHSVNRIRGQELSNKHSWASKNTGINNYQQQPKHSSSLPSIVEGLNNIKYKGNIVNSQLNQSDTQKESKTPIVASTAKFKNRNGTQLLNSESVESRVLGNSSGFLDSSENVTSGCENKNSQNRYDREEITNSFQDNTSQSKNSEFTTQRSQSHSPKAGKHSLIPKSSTALNLEKGSGSSSAEKYDTNTVQKRRISRFLRPDFYDTPPEESTYVKEREAKKAAEAEIKKARRLARRTSSMRETPLSKTEAIDASKMNKSESIMPLIKCSNNKSEISSNIKSEALTKNLEDACNEKLRLSSKISSSLASLTEDNSNQKQVWSSFRKGENLRTSGSGLCALPKSRVGQAISSLQGQNFTPWDKRVVATESTYLKRAVSVDDVSLKSQSSLTKSNPKLGRKISSVLGLFSKLDTTPAENNILQNTTQSKNDGEIKKRNSKQTCLQSKQKLSSPCSSISDKVKNKIEEKKLSLISNSGEGEGNGTLSNTKELKSSKDMRNKQEIRKNHKKVAAQVISDAICNSKDTTKKMPVLKSNVTDTKCVNAFTKNHPFPVTDSKQESNENFSPSTKTQSSDKVSSIDAFSNCGENKIPAAVCSSPANEKCKQLSLLSSQDCTLTNANDLGNIFKSTVETENSLADETESVDSWYACSDIDGQENVSVVLGDEEDKESESVEDRIRRKSFYSRFNDVKKKGRKKSSQFLKDCRTSIPPGNYHKNIDNQSLLLQPSNTGMMNRKSPIPVFKTESYNRLGDTNIIHSMSCPHNSLLQTNKSSELCSLSEKESVRSSNNPVIEESDGPSNTCALLRPTAFAQGVIKKTTSGKGNSQTQLKEGSSLNPQVYDTMPISTSAVIADDNSNQEAQAPTS